MTDLGKALILLGVALVLVGGLVWLAGNVPPSLKWIGRLPGDITYRRSGVTVYFPLASCLLASVILSLLFSLFFRR